VINCISCSFLIVNIVTAAARIVFVIAVKAKSLEILTVTPLVRRSFLWSTLSTNSYNFINIRCKRKPFGDYDWSPSLKIKIIKFINY
jgi:hypothetical protein